MSQYAPEGTFVTLFNPATGDPWQCPTDAVEHYVEKGWSKTAPTKKAAEAAKGVKAND